MTSEKNWFKISSCEYQEARPGNDWAAVEDYQQMAVEQAWGRLFNVAPLGAIVTYELLERLRVIHQK